MYLPTPRALLVVSVDSGGPMPFNEADFTRDAARMVAEGDRVPEQRWDTCVMTMTLADFLLARIAEDEAVLLRKSPDGDGGSARGTIAYQVIHWDSRRLGLECEAKRRIISARDSHEAHAEQYSDRDSEFIAQGLYDAMVALARAYAEHADYREEWSG